MFTLYVGSLEGCNEKYSSTYIERHTQKHDVLKVWREVIIDIVQGENGYVITGVKKMGFSSE